MLKGSYISLRNRFRLYLLIMAIILTSIGVSLLPRIYHQGLVDSSHGMLFAAANDFEQRFLVDQNAKPLQSSEIFSYLNLKDIPEDLQRYFDVASLDYEQPYLEEWPSGDIYIVCYFYKKALGDTGNTLYLFQKIDVSKRPEHAFSTITKIQWAFALLSLLLVYIFSKGFIKHVVSPVISLSHWLDNNKKDEPPKPLPTDLNDDEIGHVAIKLHEALQDSYDFTEREKHFLQNASHELRTPIAIVQNAAELAQRQLSLKKGDINESLMRIKNTAIKMKGLTEGLLWLTRTKTKKIDSTDVNISATLQKILNNNLAINSSRDWQVEFTPDLEYTAKVPQVLFEICIDNLIRNAFQHASDAYIRIEYTSSTLKIYNHSEEDQSISQEEILRRGVTSGQGFGIGLSIVAQIAETRGWEVSISFNDDTAIVSLNFAEEKQ